MGCEAGAARRLPPPPRNARAEFTAPRGDSGRARCLLALKKYKIKEEEEEEEEEEKRRKAL